MTEWLYEAGIGEARAALVASGRIIEAAIEPKGVPHIGAVLPGRLLAAGERRVGLGPGGEALLDRPCTKGEGHPVRVEILREPIPEHGRTRPARARVTEAEVRAGPDLLQRILATGLPVRRAHPHEPDFLEQAGWSELLEEARAGDIAFGGGMLRVDCTRAMTLVDIDLIDGGADALEHAFDAIGAALRRHGIGGSVGIDVPTVEGRAARQALDQRLDAALTRAGVSGYERTGLNGFGFVQLILPRPRASLPERMQYDPAAPLRLLLRQLERNPPPHGSSLPSEVAARLTAQPDWRLELERRTGRRFVS